MQIDRRITNGLAWAGAILVVGVPLADMGLRQFAPDAPQVAIVQEETATSLPTPAVQRPAAPASQPSTPVADPVTTANVTPRNAGGNAVDSFLESGRELPSYISGGSTTTPATSTPKPAATPAPAKTEAAQPAQPAATPAPMQTATPKPQPSTQPQREETAALPATKLVTLPTPVSQRPPSVAQAPVVQQAVTQPNTTPPGLISPRPTQQQQPLIIEQPSNEIITAQDLEAWESGPLSEFLARRNGGNAPASDYQEGGFFLDEMPNNRRVQRLPDAYEDDYFFPFQ